MGSYLNVCYSININLIKGVFVEKAFNLKTVLVAIVIGFLLVLGLTFYTGSNFASPLLPFMAILAGFIVTGLLVGFMSKGETISEPGIASVGVGLLSYFIIPAFNFHCFVLLPAETVSTNLLLVMLNGIILTFMGAWAGEKLQGTYENDKKSESTTEWAYIIAGSVLGITLSMLLANLIVIIAGAASVYLFFALLFGLGLTGFVIGLRSPGVTIREATIAGIVTIIFNLDIFKITLDPDTFFLDKQVIILSLAVGIAISFLGGYFGEKVQGNV